MAEMPYPADIQSQMQEKQLEAAKKQILARMLSKEAYERLARVRTVNATLAGQAELYLLQIFQTGKIKEQIKDAQLKEILRALSEGEKSINIEFRRG